MGAVAERSGAALPPGLIPQPEASPLIEREENTLWHVWEPVTRIDEVPRGKPQFFIVTSLVPNTFTANEEPVVALQRIVPMEKFGIRIEAHQYPFGGVYDLYRKLVEGAAVFPHRLAEIDLSIERQRWYDACPRDACQRHPAARVLQEREDGSVFDTGLRYCYPAMACRNLDDEGFSFTEGCNGLFPVEEARRRTRAHPTRATLLDFQ